MRLALWCRIFLTCWYCGVGSFFLEALLAVLAGNIGAVELLLVAAGLFTLGQVRERLGFNIQARNAADMLEDLLG